MPHAEQSVGLGADALIDVNEVQRPAIQILGDLLGVQNLSCQRLQASLARDGRERLLLGFEGKVQIFQTLGRGRRLNFTRQRVREFALRLDRLEDRSLSFSEHAGTRNPILNLSDLLFIQAAGHVLSVPGDEGHGVAFIQQLHRASQLFFW